jgi:hypothetical protein
MGMFAQRCESLCGHFRQVAARFVAPTVAATAMLLPASTLSAQDYEIWALDQGTNEEFINTNPQVGAGRGSAYNLYKRAR